jgi:hypothetical protein
MDNRRFMMRWFSRGSVGGTSVCVWLAAAGLLIAGVAGCGRTSAEHRVASVKGKVVANGEAVKGGSITLQPIEVAGAAAGSLGKPASGEVKDDGTFVLSTYGDQDGAVVGKHRVSYLPMMRGAEKYGEKVAKSPYAHFSPKLDQVEVKAGANDITIELVSKK